MSSERRQLGIDGERAAEHFLRGRGYTILERNYRCPHGEIDLIALHGRSVVFVEVKTRRGAAADVLYDAVDPRKQRQIARAAEHYLSARRLYERPVRFDVVAVWPQGGALACELLQDAFDPEDPAGW